MPEWIVSLIVLFNETSEDLVFPQLYCLTFWPMSEWNGGLKKAKGDFIHPWSMT